MPIFLKQLGPAIAFGIPGALMFISTVILWGGRKHYVMVPPAPPDPDSFLRVARTALASGWPGQLLAAAGAALAVWSVALIPQFGVVISLCLALVAVIACGGGGVWLQLAGARSRHPAEAVEGVRSVLRVLVLFALVTPFWSLFDQKASTWVLQANAMTKPSWFQSSQMQALNPALVMLLIPFNNFVLFPALQRVGYEMTALRRMTAGIAFAGVSWVIVGAMQVILDDGHAFSIAWQVLPYAFLTLGEVLVSATGLEFAYSQAPAAMKGALMSFWYLSITVGNLWVLVSNAGVRHPVVIEAIASTGYGVTALQMFFFAAFALVAAAVFGLVARSYQVVDYYRK
jgi:POT family proton-dependent oligopeptide transporter